MSTGTLMSSVKTKLKFKTVKHETVIDLPISPAWKPPDYPEPVFLSYEVLLKLTDKVVTKYGPRHADGIGGKYFRAGEPSCIVGAILAEAKLINPANVRDGQPSWNGSGIAGVIKAGVFNTSSEGLLFLGQLQGYNDNQVRWATAAELARRDTNMVMGREKYSKIGI